MLVLGSVFVHLPVGKLNTFTAKSIWKPVNDPKGHIIQLFLTYMVTDFQKGLLATRVVFYIKLRGMEQILSDFFKKSNLPSGAICWMFFIKYEFFKGRDYENHLEITDVSVWGALEISISPPSFGETRCLTTKKRFQLCSSQSLQEKKGHTNQVGSKNFKIHGNPPISINTFYPFFVSSTSFRKKKTVSVPLPHGFEPKTTHPPFFSR